MWYDGHVARAPATRPLSPPEQAVLLDKRLTHGLKCQPRTQAPRRRRPYDAACPIANYPGGPGGSRYGASMSGAKGGPPAAVGGTKAVAVVVTVAALVLAVHTAVKLSCSNILIPGCYSDIVQLWDTRAIWEHRFPYVGGYLDAHGQPGGGTYEYPTLSGLLIWATSLPARTAHEFLVANAVVMVAIGLMIAALLAMRCGYRALFWAVSPALALYPLLNWDLPAVLFAVLGLLVLTRPGSLRARVLAASACFAVGFCLKVYPGLFLLPVLAGVLFAADGNGRYGLGHARPRRPTPDRIRLAVEATSVFGVIALAANLPFIIAGWEGWLASVQFQGDRRADLTTNSIWYWGLRRLIGEGALYDVLVSLLSPTLILVGVVAVLVAAWRRAETAALAGYPWVQASAAALCVFLLFHKVHSPQYALWLVPFFVLLRVPWPLIVGYGIADVAVGQGFFAWFVGRPWGGELLEFGVWTRVVLLVLLIPVFLRAELGWMPRRAPSSALLRPVDGVAAG